MTLEHSILSNPMIVLGISYTRSLYLLAKYYSTIPLLIPIRLFTNNPNWYSGWTNKM